MAHPTRREVLIGRAALLAVAATGTSDLTTQLNALPLPGNQGEFLMSTITTKDGTTIFYKDWGPKDAQPIVFHHGWPLSSDDWDNQMLFFLSNGYRVVAHDRRGQLSIPSESLLEFRLKPPLYRGDTDSKGKDNLVGACQRQGL